MIIDMCGALENEKLPALLFLASPVGCLAFGFEPCFDEGDGPP